MKLSAILLLLVVGCVDSDDPRYPVVPSGSPGAGGSTGGGDGSSTARVTGRVCVLADPTLMSACAINGAGGLTVAMAGQTTTTLPDGSFSITPTDAVSPTTNLSVTGTGIVASQRTIGGSNVVPVMNQQLFDDMFLATGISPEPQTGTIIANVVNGNGVPSQGLTATSTPTGVAGPFFDGAGATPWTTDLTGARGVAMFPNVATTGSTSLSFTDAESNETTIDGIQVVDGGITYVDTTLE